MLEVCAEFRNPVGIVTKSALIRRDIDVLQSCVRRVSGSTFDPIADPEIACAVEPLPIAARSFAAMKELADAAYRWATIADDSRRADILTVGAAMRARVHMLRSRAVSRYFEQRLREKLPMKADRVLNRIRDTRRQT